MRSALYDDTVLVYRAIELHVKPISIKELQDRCDLPRNRLDAVFTELCQRRLVALRDGFVVPSTWWDWARVEVSFSVPQVSEQTFREVCKDIKVFAEDGADRGVVQPYVHETTIIIAASVAAGIVLAEFARAFFGEWGKEFAQFASRVIAKHRNNGVREITIQGTYEPASTGEMRFTFEVKGRSSAEVMKGLEYVEKELVASLQSRSLTSDLVRQGDGWKITVWKA